MVSVCLLAGAVHGQEDKNFDIKKLLELYKTAKKGGFNFEKVNFDAVSSLSQIIKWQKYNNTRGPWTVLPALINTEGTGHKLTKNIT